MITMYILEGCYHCNLLKAELGEEFYDSIPKTLLTDENIKDFPQIQVAPTLQIGDKLYPNPTAKHVKELLR